VLTDMLAVRFGTDQAHFAKPLKMRPSSDSCAEPEKEGKTVATRPAFTSP